MPNAPKRYRPFPKRKASSEQNRPTASARGYGSRWQRFQKQYLNAHPPCVECGQGATCVDHKDGKGPLGERGYDETNLQALCARCHGKKTVQQDGGFGRTKKSVG